MKKLIFLSIFLLGSLLMQGQIITKQIAFGAKTIDSLTGTAAGATVGSKYYYLNMAGTVASGLVKSTTTFTQYEVLAVQVALVAPTKAADMMDSTQISIEISYDNTNWVKWTNAGATTTTTQWTQYKNGGPGLFGTGTTYTYVPDLVTVANAAGGAVFMFNGLVAPYVRVFTKSYDDATGAYYPLIYFTLKHL